jgi:hypothetical protein
VVAKDVNRQQPGQLLFIGNILEGKLTAVTVHGMPLRMVLLRHIAIIVQKIRIANYMIID